MELNDEKGTFPAGWTTLPIEQLTPRNKKFGIVDGPFGSNLKTEHYRKSGVPIVTSGYVTSGKFSAKTYLYVDLQKYKQEIRSAVKGGDIVMAKIGEGCGASAMLPINHPDSILSGNALKITVDENRFSTELLSHILWNLYCNGQLEALRTIGAQPAISMANLKKFPILLPLAKTEQTAIATALSDTDALISSLEKLIAKKRNIKQGVMQELLRPKEGWKETELGQICIPSNVRINPITNDKDFVCIELEHLAQGTGQLLGHALSKNLKSQKTVFKSNDVLFGKLRPYLRKYFYAEFDGVCSSEIWVLRSQPKISSKFLYYLIQTDQVIEAANLSTGTKMPRAEWKTVATTKIHIPENLDEQQEIARILSTADCEIHALEVKLEKLMKVKLGVAANLLTGKIRIV